MRCKGSGHKKANAASSSSMRSNTGFCIWTASKYASISSCTSGCLLAFTNLHDHPFHIVQDMAKVVWSKLVALIVPLPYMIRIACISPSVGVEGVGQTVDYVLNLSGDLKLKPKRLLH